MLKTNRPTQQLWTEEAAGVDEVSSGDEIIETELRDPYPKRQRRHPQTLTYDRLGQPHFTERIVSTQGIDVRDIVN